MVKISKIIDAIGKFISLFFVTIVLFRCLKVPFNISCLLGIVVSLFILTFINMIKRFKREFNREKEEDKKNIDNITEQFVYSNTNQIKQYLMRLFNRKYQNVTSHKFGFTFSKENEMHLVFLYYNQPNLDSNNFLNIYRQVLDTKFNNIHIFCFNYEQECSKALERFKKRKFELYDIKQLYFAILKPANSMPNFDIEKIYIPKYTLKSIWQGVFSKRKAKSYFWFGMLLFISSFFVPMNVYYLVFSLILFTLSFISRFVVKTPEVAKKETIIWQ